MLRFVTKVVLVGLVFSSCSSRRIEKPSEAASGCTQRTVERLYFGSGTPHGSVSPKQWQKFLEAEVTPRFPAGFTVIEGKGQWLGANKKIVRETTRVLEIVHGDDASEYRAIDDIIGNYKKQFEQEAVLRLVRKSLACL